MGKECRTNLRISLVWPILKMSANILAAWRSSDILYSYVCTVVVILLENGGGGPI